MTRVKRASIKGGVDPSLRVSLYPFDVDTATLDQMAFDARFANMERFMQGYATTPLLNDESQPGTVTVSFGRAFTTAPLVIASYGGFSPASDHSGSSFSITYNPSGGGSYWDLRVGTNSMTFRSYTSFGQYFFRYIVFKPEN
jgi:hypothetical protein